MAENRESRRQEGAKLGTVRVDITHQEKKPSRLFIKRRKNHSSC